MVPPRLQRQGAVKFRATHTGLSSPASSPARNNRSGRSGFGGGGGDGDGSGGGGGFSGTMPLHPKAIMRGLRQSGASLSAFLGLGGASSSSSSIGDSGSGSGSDGGGSGCDGGDGDAGSGGGGGSGSGGVGVDDGSGGDGGSSGGSGAYSVDSAGSNDDDGAAPAAATVVAVDPVAMLYLGEVTFEVSPDVRNGGVCSSARCGGRGGKTR